MSVHPRRPEYRRICVRKPPVEIGNRVSVGGFRQHLSAELLFGQNAADQIKCVQPMIGSPRRDKCRQGAVEFVSLRIFTLQIARKLADRKSTRLNSSHGYIS